MKCLDKKVEFSFRTDAGGVVLLTVEPDGTFQTERIQVKKGEPRTLSTDTLTTEDMSLVPCCRDFYSGHFDVVRGAIHLANPLRFYAPLDFPGEIDVTKLLNALAVGAVINKQGVQTVILNFNVEISPALVQILQWVESGSLDKHYFKFFITLLINSAAGTYSWIPGQDVQPQNIFTPDYTGLTGNSPVMKLVMNDPSIDVEAVDKESFQIQCLGVTAVY
jgi:hypothetical protein